jgi:uncharacterized protein with NAD-binding domain and iron-sulfur cluster
MAGLAAAWRLSEPGWRERFSSIAVVESGFRLGGKGASSRGPHGRVEEHGLHVWLGHYDNAFRLIRQCYEELDRTRSDPRCPIRTWQDAFFPTGDLGLFDRSEAGWVPWVARFSRNRLLPGQPDIEGGVPSLAELVLRSALLIRDFHASLDFGALCSPAVTISTSPFPARASRTSIVVGTLGSALLAVSQELTVLASLGARRLAGPPGAARINTAFAPLLASLRPALRADLRARRLHDLIDLIRAVLSGMARDGLWDSRDAYDAINHLDFRDWLRGLGAQPSTLESAIVRGQYDLVFSHENGNPARPRFAAGWGVFLSSRLWFDYKGAIFWKMRAGMGDVVFAPLYQTLAGRGVEFRFLTSVEELVPSTDGSAIRSVVVGHQVLAAGVGEYQPLTRVRELPCFPAAPDSSQFAVSPVRAPGRPMALRELHSGADFDLLVLAIPPAASRRVCRRLAAQRRAWSDMLDGISSVPTHSFQVWLRPDERALGWPHPGTTMSAFAKPFDTWASMSHLLDVEDWNDAVPPSTIAYFCSTLADADDDDPSTAADRTRRLAIQFLERHSRCFWPNAVHAETNRLRWEYLCAPDDSSGPERFDFQYWTANVAPSDRYVQSLPGTDACRLRPDQAGYANLVLAGDWTDCGINAGCIEAAVVSGLQAANVLLGRGLWHRIGGRLLR